jgi:hypothetical protein
MAKKKTAARRAAAPPQSLGAFLGQEITTLAADPRKRRFYTALAMSLTKLIADDMDKIEPLLVTVIGRAELKRQSGE